MTTTLIIVGAVALEILATWASYGMIRDTNPAPNPAGDLILCAFFWWLFLPIEAILKANESAKHRERTKRETPAALKSGSENGLYE